MRAIRSLTFVISLLACLIRPADGQIVQKQWQSLATFPNTIYVVYFMDLPGPPRIGFAGSLGMIYRTTDGGGSWNPTISTDYNYRVSDIVFKDSLVGWFTNYDGYPGSQLFTTTDGGLTWKGMSAPVFDPTSLFYNKSNQLLFISGLVFKNTGTLANSSDDGITWNVIPQHGDFTGFAFLNSDSGILTHEIGSSGFRTADGGQSWANVITDANECFQPIADTFRNVYWAASERGTGYPSQSNDMSVMYESLDAGQNFKIVTNTPSITGTIREGSCGVLYLQSSDDDREGILQSNDGLVWSKLLDMNGNSGPYNNQWDTRFFITGTYVFAAGQIPTDKTNQIWRYVEDSTKFGGTPFTAPAPSTKHFDMIASDCNSLDSTLYVLYQNDCIPGELESVHSRDSLRFLLPGAATLPAEIKGSIKISVEHIPESPAPDSTLLYLKYFANGRDIYDTVLVTAEIIGGNILAPFDILANGTKNLQVSGGEYVVVSYVLTDSLAQIGLDSLHFQTSFDGDVLSFKSVQAVTPWLLLSEAHSEGFESFTATHPSTQPALANSPIVNVTYKSDVAKNASTKYYITDLWLNQIEFSGCAGPASLPEPPEVTVSGCGDTLLRQFMSGKSVLELLGTEQVGDESVVVLRSAETEPVTIEVFDMLGQRESIFERSATANEIERIPLDGLKNGFHFITINAAGERLTAKIIVGNR